MTRGGRTLLDRATTGWVRLDAADARAVAEVAAGHDVLVSAVRPRPDQEQEVEQVTLGLAHGAGRAGVRLVVVGGAGPLHVPGTDRIAIEDTHWVPAAYRPAAAASVHQLGILRASTGLDWTYLAPAAQFQAGERIGTYRTGGDELVIGADGSSMISMEDFAIAALDEIQHPTVNCDILSVGT